MDKEDKFALVKIGIWGVCAYLGWIGVENLYKIWGFW